MAFEILGMSGTALYVFLFGIFALGDYMGLYSILPTRKKTTALLGVGALGIGLVMGGVIALPGQTAEEEGGGAQAMQYLDVGYEDSATHVSSGDGDEVKVEYTENSSGAINFESTGTALDNAVFDIALNRIDTSTDNDLVFGITANSATVENADADDSPFDLYERTSDDKVEVEITPSGKTGSYEYNNTVISAAGSSTVTIDAVPNTTALQNIEVYDSVSSTITIRGPNGGIQHTLELTWLKVG